jgi:ABC-2 type transport system ATP-binding protein
MISDRVPPKAAIYLEGVSKRFGSTRGLDRLSLRVETGAVFGFLGPNGAGKTTTIRCLLGLVRPDAGTMTVMGLDPRDDGGEVRRRVGALLENDGLYARLTALQNLDFHARIRHLETPVRLRRMEELLRSFGLWERRHEAVINWSKGMRQKLAIARALLHRPDLLLLDEPFSGLDPTAAVELRERIVALARDGGVTILLTTHDLAHVEKSCTAVAVIQQGTVLASGTPEDLSASGDRIEVEVTGAGLNDDLLASMQRAALIFSYDQDGRSARINCARNQRSCLAQELMKRGVVIDEIRNRQNSLEDVFLSLVARGPQEQSHE